MFQAHKNAPDIQTVINKDLYSEGSPSIDGIKQVIDTLKSKAQAITPQQIQAKNYLLYLQDRPIHEGKKVYQNIIDSIEKDGEKVASPGYFIRVIESLLPRPIYMDEKSYNKYKKDSGKD